MVSNTPIEMIEMMGARMWATIGENRGRWIRTRPDSKMETSMTLEARMDRQQHFLGGGIGRFVNTLAGNFVSSYCS